MVNGRRYRYITVKCRENSGLNPLLQVLLNAFRKEGAQAIEIAKQKRKEREEAERKRKEASLKKRQEEEAAAAVIAQQSASITELTDEEAAKIQQEIDAKKQ